MGKPGRIALLSLINFFVNCTMAGVVSGLALLFFQYLMCHGKAPENMTWFGVFLAGGLISLMYASAGLLMASVSTAALCKTWFENSMKSLLTGAGGGLIFVMAFVLLPINHEKLKVLLGAVSCLVASLLYLDSLLKQRKEKMNEGENKEERDSSSVSTP